MLMTAPSLSSLNSPAISTPPHLAAKTNKRNNVGHLMKLKLSTDAHASASTKSEEMLVAVQV
jgi:hypothetical protein